MTLSSRKAIESNLVEEVLFLAEDPTSLLGDPTVPFAGSTVSWSEAGSPSTHRTPTPRVVVLYEELLRWEARTRHKALTSLCAAGTELIVASGLSDGAHQTSANQVYVYPPATLRNIVSTIQTVLPFASRLEAWETSASGKAIFCFRLEHQTVTTLGEVVPVAQHFWSKDGRDIYLSSGFYQIEQISEHRYCWMAERGTVLVKPAREELVKVELWVELFIARPTTVMFGAVAYNVFDKAKLTYYASIIPGHNPINIEIKGLVDSPSDRGNSIDTRKLGLRLLAASVVGL
jgi:hypothetical protein